MIVECEKVYRSFTKFLTRIKRRKDEKTLTTGKIVQTFPNDEYPKRNLFDGQTAYIEMLPRDDFMWNALFSLKVHVQEKFE